MGVSSSSTKIGFVGVEPRECVRRAGFIPATRPALPRRFCWFRKKCAGGGADASGIMNSNEVAVLALSDREDEDLDLFLVLPNVLPDLTVNGGAEKVVPDELDEWEVVALVLVTFGRGGSCMSACGCFCGKAGGRGTPLFNDKANGWIGSSESAWEPGSAMVPTFCMSAEALTGVRDALDLLSHVLEVLGKDRTGDVGLPVA